MCNDNWEVSGYLLKQIEEFMGVKVVDKDINKSQFYLSNGESIGIYGREKMFDKGKDTRSRIGINKEVASDAKQILIRIDDYDITALIPCDFINQNKRLGNEFLEYGTRYNTTYVYDEDNDAHSLTLKERKGRGSNLLDIDKFVIDLPFIDC